MLKTFHLYILKRWLLSMLGSALFFGGLLLANDLVRISRELFSQGASIQWLIPILLTTIPETLTLVLPMSAILGGLMGTQSLAEGSETVASQGLGAGTGVILKPWALLSALIIALGLLNANWVVPKVGGKFREIESRMIEETKVRFLRPGAPPFISPKKPQMGIWVAPEKEIHLFEVTDSEVEHLVARDMIWNQVDDGRGNAQLVLQLFNLRGCRLDRSNGTPGLIQQESLEIPYSLPAKPGLVAPLSDRYLPTGQILNELGKYPMLSTAPPMPQPERDHYVDLWIELARRISIPVSTIALLLIGIALGHAHPRFQKGGAILNSLGVILAYYFCMKYLENAFQLKSRTPLLLFITPALFLLFGIYGLARRLRPHRRSRWMLHSLQAWLGRPSLGKVRDYMADPLSLADAVPLGQGEPSVSWGNAVMGRWTRRTWLKNWMVVLGALLVLDAMLEFAPITGDLVKNQISLLRYAQYWLLNLPAFMVIAFPMAFLLAGVMSFSDAAMHREWMALKAGGVSLLQWIASGAKAWIAVALLAFVTQAVIAPMTIGKASDIYREIRNQPPRSYQNKPWMHLASTDVLWYLGKDVRYGFPLASPEAAPVLYQWKKGAAQIDQLVLGELHFSPGPEAATQFPSEALRRSSTAEETNTLDLFLWQKWAPDPETAAMLWGRLLDWLAGPCLMFATLAFAFPSPRGGRGRVLGNCLIAGLFFLGLQALFSGAARAGEIPALWGISAPLMVLVGIGLFNLRRLRT
jgi:lipopolysaccharide export LptBFGC system permease protein LptF